MQHQSTRAERFWAKVKRTDACWLWVRGRNAHGYGIASNGKKSGLILAHRLSYELTYGPIPTGLHVCHHCDNPPCVRPDHLFLGTDADNVADMMRKGRYGPPRSQPKGAESWSRNHLDRLARGQGHGCARLTDEQVMELRRLRIQDGLTLTQLTEMFAISKSQAFRIVRRQSWTHLP